MESVERPLTTKQAAEFLGVHFKTVEKFAREGRIPAHRIGGRILRFYETELDIWLRGTVSSASQSAPREQEIQ